MQDKIRVYIPYKPPVLARVWRCTACGAKVFFGRLGPMPRYRCLCGNLFWQAQNDPQK